MRALITGGAGFIGSHLAERCLREGWFVSVLDDLSTGSFQNIAHLKGHPKFEYTIDTVFNGPLVSELVDCCDIVFHLAAAVGVRLVVDSPVHTIETNVHGTEVVLCAAAKKRKRILIASTSEVYGKSVKVPFSEDDDLVMGPTKKGRWSYACSKALDEFLGLAYHNEKHVPVTIIRLFNTVGSRQTGRYGMVLPNFVRQALLDEPITVYGDGSQRRCFGYVLDAVEASATIRRSRLPPWPILFEPACARNLKSCVSPMKRFTGQDLKTCSVVFPHWRNSNASLATALRLPWRPLSIPSRVTCALIRSSFLPRT